MKLRDLVTDEQLKEKDVTRESFAKIYCPPHFGLGLYCSEQDSFSCEECWGKEVDDESNTI